MVRRRTQQNGNTTDISLRFYWNNTTKGTGHIYEVGNPNFIPRTCDWVNVKNVPESDEPLREVVMVEILYLPSKTEIKCYVV